MWEGYLAGESGLVHAATGPGKTYAAWMGPLLEWLGDYRGPRDRRPAPPLRVLWITPLRALAADTEAALRAPIAGDRRFRWTRGVAHRRHHRPVCAAGSAAACQPRWSPRPRACRCCSHATMPPALFAAPRVGDRRRVARARWRQSAACRPSWPWRACAGGGPSLRRWGLSATLGNLDDGARCAARVFSRRPRIAPDRPRASCPRPLEVDALIPEPHRAIPVGRPDRPPAAPRWSAQSRKGRRHSSSPTRARSRDLVPGDPRGEARTGPAIDRPAPRLARPATREWVEAGYGKGACAVSSAPRRSTWASTSRRWIGCCRWAVPRASGRLIQRAGRSGHRPGRRQQADLRPDQRAGAGRGRRRP